MTIAHVRALRLSGALRAKGHTLSEDILAAEWKAVDRAKRTAERRLAEAISPVLLAYVERAADRLSVYRRVEGSAVTSAKADPVSAVTSFAVDVDALLDELLAVLSPAVVEVLRAGWASGMVRVGASLAFDAERASVREASARLLSLAESVPETLRSHVDTVVRDGLARGLSGDDLAAAVRAVVPDMTVRQAATVARSTGNAAFEAGQAESFAAAGVERKRWLTMRDANVRDEHAAMDGEEVGIGEAFSNGEEYPGSINCRCTVLPVVTAAKAPPRGRAWRVERDNEIKASYPELRDRHGREVALDRLAERHSVSVETVRRAIGQK